MPDPKLKAAMEEIKVVLNKHDIGGVVVLASPTHLEYLNHLSASWSCIHVNGDEVRVRCKLVDYPSKEVQKKVLEDSVGMLAGFNDVMARLQEGFGTIVLMIGEEMEIRHWTRYEDDNR